MLLDYGSWLYLPQGIVMRDRAAPIGEAGFTQTADWSGLLERIRRRHYAKILVRDYHSPDFAYDHGIWPRSSGVRAALEENYRETRRIPAVAMRGVPPPWLQTISVLVPKPAQPGPTS